jgi:hypothetical protein
VKGRVTDEAASLRPVTAESYVRSRVSSFAICGGKSVTKTGFSSSSSVLHRTDYSPNASYSEEQAFEACVFSNKAVFIEYFQALEKKVPSYCFPL